MRGNLSSCETPGLGIKAEMVLPNRRQLDLAIKLE